MSGRLGRRHQRKHAVCSPAEVLYLPTGAGSLMVWDSMFFGRIVHAGYEHEQFYAFLPLYPVLVRALAACGALKLDRILTAVRLSLCAIGSMAHCCAGKGKVAPGFSMDAWTAISAIAISNIAFVVSAVYFNMCADESAAIVMPAVHSVIMINMLGAIQVELPCASRGAHSITGNAPVLHQSSVCFLLRRIHGEPIFGAQLRRPVALAPQALAGDRAARLGIVCTVEWHTQRLVFAA